MQWFMTPTRPIDAVPWSAHDPQEDEIGLARLTFDTNMAGVAFPQQYLHHFRRCVLGATPHFERQLLQFTRLTWLHDGVGKRRLLIKNSAHTARVPLLLRLFPRARFVVLQREPVDSVRSLVQVKHPRLTPRQRLQEQPWHHQGQPHSPTHPQGISRAHRLNSNARPQTSPCHNTINQALGP